MDAPAAAAAAAAAGRADQLGRASMAFSVSAVVAASTVPGGMTGAVVGAMLASFFTLFVGVWLSMVGRGRRGIGFVNLSISVLALLVAVAHGGSFDLDLLLKIYNAL